MTIDGQLLEEAIDASPAIYYLYRTVNPQQFEKMTGKPRPPAFHLRNEASLSVWDARMVQPRQLFQAYLDGVMMEIASEDEAKRKKAENRLNTNGDTPEAMYRNKWRIVRLTETDFVSLGLPVGPPREDGHRDVFGTSEAFEESAFALVEASVVLSEEATLA